MVRQHSQTDGFCLVSTNQNIPADKMVITHATIKNMAPVVWKRRQDV